MDKKTDEDHRLNKCIFSKICKNYNVKSYTCNIEPGDYCGKFRELKIGQNGIAV